MSIIINLTEIIEDQWVDIDASAEVDDGARVIVSFERLTSDWKKLTQASCSLGVELAVTDRVEEIETYLPRLELVVLNFASFTDGRAFSQARILRERFGFHGDIRAKGEVLRDQLDFMQRCGINQFCLADSEVADQALSAFSDINKSYQPELRQPGC